MQSNTPSEPAPLDTFKLELREEIDQRVRDHIDRTKAWLETIVGWSIKIVAIGGALVILALGLLGYRNFSDLGTRLTEITKDVERQAKDAIAAQKPAMDKKIDEASAAATKTLDEKIQHQLDQAVVSVLLAKWQSQKGDRFARLDLDTWETERLVAIVRNDKTKTETLLAALQILARAKPMDTVVLDEEIEKLLVAFIGAEKVERANEPRLRALLRWLVKQNRPTLAPPVRVLLTRASTEETLKMDAVRFLSAVRDDEALQWVEREIGKAKDKLQQEMLVALAKGKPGSPAVTNWITTTIQKPELELEEAYTASRVLLNLAAASKPRRLFERNVENPQDKNNRETAAQKLLVKLAQAHVGLYYGKDGFDKNANGVLMIGLEKNPGNYFFIDEEVLFETEVIITKLLGQTIASRDATLLRELVRVLTVSGRDSGFSDKYAAALSFALEDSASIQLTNKQSILASEIVGDPVLLPGAAEHNPIVKWRDSTGHINTGEFDSLTSIEKCRFRIKELRKLDFDDE